jgi:hypothetical protein
LAVPAQPPPVFKKYTHTTWEEEEEEEEEEEIFWGTTPRRRRSFICDQKHANVCKLRRRRRFRRRRREKEFCNHYKNDMKMHAHTLSGDAGTDPQPRSGGGGRDGGFICDQNRSHGRRRCARLHGDGGGSSTKCEEGVKEGEEGYSIKDLKRHTVWMGTRAGGRLQPHGATQIAVETDGAVHELPRGDSTTAVDFVQQQQEEEEEEEEGVPPARRAPRARTPRSAIALPPPPDRLSPPSPPPSPPLQSLH